MTTAPTLPATMTVREAADYLGIARNSAYAAIQRGEIPSLRIGKRIVVPRNRLAEMLASAPREAKSP